jgi:hypothetical protein
LEGIIQQLQDKIAVLKTYRVYHRVVPKKTALIATGFAG